MAPDPDRTKGLYDKYRVTRTDGSSEPGGKHESCRYFVLDLNHDRFARPALIAYIRACAYEYPKLAQDLRALVGKTALGAPGKETLAEDDLAEIFQSAPNHPLWRALMLLIDSFRETCIEVSKDPRLPDKETHMSIGGIATMDDLVEELEARAGGA